VEVYKTFLIEEYQHNERVQNVDGSYNSTITTWKVRIINPLNGKTAQVKTAIEAKSIIDRISAMGGAEGAKEIEDKIREKEKELESLRPVVEEKIQELRESVSQVEQQLHSLKAANSSISIFK
jgi:hypothetical protein